MECHPAQMGAWPCQPSQHCRTGTWSAAEVQRDQSKQMELGLSKRVGKPRREVQYVEKAGAGGDKPRISGVNIPSGMANQLPSADTGLLKMETAFQDGFHPQIVNFLCSICSTST